MDLYQYFEENIDITKIQEFDRDDRELAIVRYVLMVTSNLFYRDIIFFLNDEQIKERRNIYTKIIDAKNIKSFEITCSSYCRVLSEVLKNKYDIRTKLIKTDRDVFKHIALLLITKQNNIYFIDPLMDLSEMKTRMRTHNFGANGKNTNPYVRVKIEGLSKLSVEKLEKIDNKIGYTNNGLYTDDILENFKNQLDVSFDIKIQSFFELIRKRVTIKGIVELMIFVKSSLKKLLNEEEINKFKIFDFFANIDDLTDKELNKITEKINGKKRGLIIEYNNKCIVFGTLNTEFLQLTKEEWEKRAEKNHIFIRKSTSIILYKYLSNLELEPNILNHRQFLKIFSKIEQKIIEEGKNPKDYIQVIDRQKLIVKYGFNIEFSIENDFLTIFNKKNKHKLCIIFEDEGRKIKYKKL